MIACWSYSATSIPGFTFQHLSGADGVEINVAYAGQGLASHVIEVAAQVGHDRFAVIGHDRGGLVLTR